MPTKFQCQSNRRKRTSNATKRPYILKKQRKTLIEECEKDLEERTVTTRLGDTLSDSMAPEHHGLPENSMTHHHFDLPNDMENYMEYHLMGSVSQVRMKPGCMPTKFQCQSNRRKRTSNATKRPYILKKQRKTLIEECEKDLEERTVTTRLGDTLSDSMAPEHHGLPENSMTHRRNHFDANHDIVKVEIKEEPIEIKWSSENGVCDKSRQEEVEYGKFHELISSNCEENHRESKPSPTHFWKNTNFDTKGSEYIFAADIEQIRKEIEVENPNEDHIGCTDDLKMQTLKTEDGVDIVFEDIKPEMQEEILSEIKTLPTTLAYDSSIDLGAGPQQNTTGEENETDVEKYHEKRFQWSEVIILKLINA
ncbi:hypothetical protein JTB14_036800 [Gonioctena quinquepunctata]|nr:hypothetical protein JTB14_036800 [Gonioctena quinquepunctata]